MGRLAEGSFDFFDSLVGPGTTSSDPGAIWRGAGKAGAWVAEEFTKAMPQHLSGALRKGIADANLSGLLGEAFANAPLAGFRQKVLNTFKELSNEIAASWEKADQAAFNYGKKIGLAGDQVARLRNEMIRFSNEAQIGIKFGKSIEEAIALQEKYTLAVGRNIRLSNEQIKDYLALSSAFGDDLAVKLTSSLDSFGMSTTEAGEMMTKMFNKSVKEGITLDKYAQNVTDHLAMAQKYTFKKGVDGLVAMAEKAAKLRVDMDMVAQLSEKLNTIGGAVDTAAQLQVLGGAFTQFADPMKLLYSSLNDMEGLQDQLAGLTNSMGRFNRMTGEVEIATFDKMRLRAAADAMGVDYGKLIEQTTTQARRNEVEYQMAGLANIPDEYKELIKNGATFQNGVAGIRGADGQFKALENLEHADFRTLVANSRTDSENIAEIAEMLRGMTDIREGEEKAKSNLAAQKYATQAESIKNVYDMIGQNSKILNELLKMQLGARVWQSFGSPVAGGAWKFGKGLIKGAGKIAGLEKGGMIRTHDDGGYISDGVPGKEMILNSAQHGEFVMNKRSTELFLPMLNMMNTNPMSLMGGGYMENPLIQRLLMEQLKESIESNKHIRRLMMTDAQGNSFMNRAIRMYDPERYKRNRAMSIKAHQTIGKFNNVLKGGMKYGLPAAASIFAGIGAGMNTWNEHKQKGTTVLNKSKAVGETAGAAIGAVAATALLSMIPYVGPFIGPTLGPIVGSAAGKAIGNAIGDGNEKRRSRKFREFHSEINNLEGASKFSTLKGSFSTKEMRQIAKALADGNISSGELKDDLREKLKLTGNEKLLAEKKKYADGGLLKGPSHEKGGISINEAEGGEYIINKEATARSINTLTKINDGSLNDSNIKAREPMGKQMKVNNNGTSSAQGSSAQSVSVKPIDINISGSIKLESNGKNFDISKELMNNPFFINQLTELITKQINIDDNKGFDKKSYYRRHTSI